MGNSRSLQRSIARHPVNVWRAKQMAALITDANKSSDDLPKHIACVNPTEKTTEVNQQGINENQSKQEETSTPNNG